MLICVNLGVSGVVCKVVYPTTCGEKSFGQNRQVLEILADKIMMGKCLADARKINLKKTRLKRFKWRNLVRPFQLYSFFIYLLVVLSVYYMFKMGLFCFAQYLHATKGSGVLLLFLVRRRNPFGEESYIAKLDWLINIILQGYMS